MELVLAGRRRPRGRRTSRRWPRSRRASCVLWLAEFAGFVVGGLPAGGSAYLALATASVVPVCVGVGALASQLAPDAPDRARARRRGRRLLFLLRVIADTSSGAGWLRWATPLGWAEELRPFTGAQPARAAAARSRRACCCSWPPRGSPHAATSAPGCCRRATAPQPRLRLLSSPTAQALRSERGSLIVWTGGVAAFAFILGRDLEEHLLRRHLRRACSARSRSSAPARSLTPTGYLAFVFIFFVLAVSLFACAQIGAARHEEADEQLETLLALPVGRRALARRAARCWR